MSAKPNGAPDRSPVIQIREKAFLNLRDPEEHLVPIDSNARNSSDPRLSLELENARVSVTPPLELINSQRAFDRMYEPNFAYPSALVSRQLNDLVVAGRIRRENLSDPVGSTPHTARINLLHITDNENVRLHHSVNLVVLFDRLR
jgi:hypothetical protein